TAVGTRRKALFRRSLAMSFRPVRRTKRAASSFVALRRTVVASLSITILSRRAMRGMTIAALRMALRTRVAVLAALTVVAAIGLGKSPFGTLHRSGAQALERVRVRGEPGGKRHNLDPLARGALDVAQITALVGAAERDRDAGGPSARGAADAVDILLGHVGQIEVHDMADARDVDPARGDVGRDQHRHVARLEACESALAMRLA